MKTTGPYNLALGTPLQIVPPDAGVEWSKVVLANMSPVAVAVEGAQWLQPWTADAYAISGTDTLTLTPNFTTVASTTTGEVTATWYLAGETLAGTYPVSLTAQAITAAVSGTVSATQGQITLADNQSVSAAAGATTLLTAAIPAGVHVNAVMLQGRAADSNSFGALIRIAGQKSFTERGVIGQATYWNARPFANYGTAAVVPMLVTVVPFPGDYEGSVIIALTATGFTQTAQLTVIGFEGTVPAFTPAPVVTSVASATVAAGGSPATILPALTDGRQYRLWSASVLPNLFTGNASYGGTQLLVGGGATPLIQAWSAPSGAPAIAPAAPLTFPDGEVVGSGAVTIANNSGICSGTGVVAYDFV